MVSKHSHVSFRSLYHEVINPVGDNLKNISLKETESDICYYSVLCQEVAVIIRQYQFR